MLGQPNMSLFSSFIVSFSIFGPSVLSWFKRKMIINTSEPIAISEGLVIDVFFFSNSSRSSVIRNI